MKRSVRRKIALVLKTLATVIIVVVIGAALYVRRPSYKLPYRAQFLPDSPDEWTAFGGVWEVVDGSMRNDSNDRGAKLVTGSSYWKNYLVEGDTQLLGEGSAGLLGRVSEAELGENSFKGYFAGVRTVDNSLVLGAYDFAYHEAAKVLLPAGVRAFRWYHISLRVEGCQIAASVSGIGMDEVKTAVVSDPDCFASGKVGLRSNGTGGVWRNVAVTPVAGLGLSGAGVPQKGARGLPPLTWHGTKRENGNLHRRCNPSTLCCSYRRSNLR